MPCYPYVCDHCEQPEDRFLTLSEYERHGKKQRCGRCRRLLRQRVVPVNLGATDDTFMNRGGDEFGGDHRERLRAMQIARAAGVNPTGKKFFPSLCRRGMPYDPLAWQDSRNSVAKRVADLNLDSDGAVKHKAARIDAPGPLERPYQVAPDIIAEDVGRINQQQFGGTMTAQQKADLTEKLTKEHSGAPLVQGRTNLPRKRKVRA